MKTQKRTSSPKKIKEEVVGDIVVGVLSQAPFDTTTLELRTPPPPTKAPKATKFKKEPNDDKYTLKVTVDISEIEALSDKIKELEKSVTEAKDLLSYARWIADIRLDALDQYVKTPWYKLLWMRFKGLI